MAEKVKKDRGFPLCCFSLSAADSDPPSKPVDISHVGKNGTLIGSQGAPKVGYAAGQAGQKIARSKDDGAQQIPSTEQAIEVQEANTDIAESQPNSRDADLKSTDSNLEPAGGRTQVTSGQESEGTREAAKPGGVQSSEDVAPSVLSWQWPHPCLVEAWKEHSATHTPKLEKGETADEAPAPQKCKIRTPAELDVIVRKSAATFDDPQHQSVMLWLLEHTQGRAGKIVTQGMSVATVAAGANPISGIVVGVFSASISLVIELGKRFGELKEALKSIDRVCELLGKAEDRKLCIQTNKPIIKAYRLILDFVCQADSLLQSPDIGMRSVSKWTGRVQQVAAHLETLVEDLMQELAITTNQGVADLKDDNYLDRMAECKMELLKVGGNWVINSDVREPAKGTCEWLLEDDDSVPIEWRRWRDTRMPAMLLVTGGIGTGKSVLSENAAKRLARPDRVVAIYHCKDDNVHDTYEEIFRGLLYQLADQSPDVSDTLTTRWIGERQKKRQPQHLFATEAALRDIFTASVQACEKDVLLIIDGLDECDQDIWQSVLNELKTFVHSKTMGSIKALVVARPETKIVESMDSLAHPTTIQLEPIQAGKKEITAIIDYYVDEFIKDRGVEWQAPFLKESFAENAEGNAQWVYLAAEGLPNMKKTKEPKLHELLKTMAKGGANKFDNVYSALFRRKAENESFLPFAQNALRIVAGASRPLTIKELSFALISMCRPGNSDITDLEQLEGFADESQIEADLPPLVRFSGIDKTIHLDHAALKEFIQNVPPDYWQSPAKEIQKHRTSQTKNINYVLTQLYLDFLSLPVFCEQDHADSIRKLPPNRNFSDPLVADSLLPCFYGYAAQSWPTHVTETGLAGQKLQKALNLCQRGSNQCNNWWAAFLYSVGRNNERFYRSYCDPGIFAACFGSMDMATAVFNQPSEDSFRFETLLAEDRGQVNVLLLLYEKGFASQKDVEKCIAKAVIHDHARPFILRQVRRWNNGETTNSFNTWPALLNAVKFGHVEIFKEFYKREPKETIIRRWEEVLLAVPRDSNHDLVKERIEIIRYFLRNKPKDLMTRLPKPGLPLLHLVVRWNIPEVVDLFLLECSQEERSFFLRDHRLNDIDSIRNGGPVLHEAFARCGTDIPIALLRHPEIGASQFDYVDSNRWNLLHYAVAFQTGSVVEALLSHKYLPRKLLNSRSRNTETPLILLAHHAGSEGDHEKARIAKILLDSGDVEEVDCRRDGGWTALCFAVSMGSLELCRTLIVHGGADWSEALRFVPGDELLQLTVTTLFKSYKFDLELFRKQLFDVIKERSRLRGENLTDVILAYSRDSAQKNGDTTLKLNPYDPYQKTYKFDPVPTAIKRTATDLAPREVQRTATF